MRKKDGPLRIWSRGTEGFIPIHGRNGWDPGNEFACNSVVTPQRRHASTVSVPSGAFLGNRLISLNPKMAEVSATNSPTASDAT